MNYLAYRKGLVQCWSRQRADGLGNHVNLDTHKRNIYTMSMMMMCLSVSLAISFHPFLSASRRTSHLTLESGVSRVKGPSACCILMTLDDVSFSTHSSVDWRSAVSQVNVFVMRFPSHKPIYPFCIETLLEGSHSDFKHNIFSVKSNIKCLSLVDV